MVATLIFVSGVAGCTSTWARCRRSCRAAAVWRIARSPGSCEPIGAAAAASMTSSSSLPSSGARRPTVTLRVLSAPGAPRRALSGRWAAAALVGSALVVIPPSPPSPGRRWHPGRGRHRTCRGQTNARCAAARAGPPGRPAGACRCGRASRQRGRRRPSGPCRNCSRCWARWPGSWRSCRSRC